MRSRPQSQLVSQALWDLRGLPGAGNTITCSDDCLHAALVRYPRGREAGPAQEYAIVDGQRQRPYTRITPAAQTPVVQFALDGSVWGYSAQQNQQELVVINGRESQRYEEIVHPWFGYDLAFSKTGGYCAFGARRHGKAFMVIDGQEMAPFDDVDHCVWSRDGTHYAYTASVRDAECLILDGVPGAFYQRVYWPQWTAEGRQVVYKVQSDQGHCVLLNQHPLGDMYENIQGITCSPSGKHIAFWGQKGLQASLIMNGKPTEITLEVEENPHSTSTTDWQILFTADDMHWAAVGRRKDNQSSVFHDGREIGTHASVSFAHFDASGHLLYLASDTDDAWFLVMDGRQHGATYRFACALLTAPQGQGYAFQAHEQDRKYLVRDGRASPRTYTEPRDFTHMKFSPDGAHFSYVARREGQEYVVLDDEEIGPYTQIAGTCFVDQRALRCIALRSSVVERVEWPMSAATSPDRSAAPFLGLPRKVAQHLWNRMKAPLAKPLSKGPSTATQPAMARASSRAPQRVRIDNTQFQLVHSVEALCAALATEHRGVLRLRSVHYREVLTAFEQKVEAQYGRFSPQYRDIWASPLLCAGCLWEFPPAYKLGLRAPGMAIQGGVPGYEQFGKTGRCPQCDSEESVWVYECFPPEHIGMADVEAIRRYWQDTAHRWWQDQRHSQAPCSLCNTVIDRGQGYHTGQDLRCAQCIHEGLMAEGLEKLTTDPHYYGAALLRKVRAVSRFS